MAAAVADYRPSDVSATKIKKSGAGLTLSLVENEDILAGLVAERPEGQIVVGFAAETGDDAGSVAAHGAAKAKRKGADLLAVNAVGAGVGFGNVPNAVTLIDAGGDVVGRASGTKLAVAHAILDAIVALRAGGGSRRRAGLGCAGDESPPLQLRIRDRGSPRQDLRPGIRRDPRRPPRAGPDVAGRDRDDGDDGARARRGRGDDGGLRRDTPDRPRGRDVDRLHLVRLWLRWRLVRRLGLHRRAVAGHRAGSRLRDRRHGEGRGAPRREPRRRRPGPHVRLRVSGHADPHADSHRDGARPDPNASPKRDDPARSRGCDPMARPR